MTERTRDLIFMVLLDGKRHTAYQIDRLIKLKNNTLRIKDELELMQKEKLVKKFILNRYNNSKGKEIQIIEWTLTKHPSFKKHETMMTALAKQRDLFLKNRDLFLKAKKEKLKTEMSVEAVIKNSDISNFENELKKVGYLNDQYPNLEKLSKKMNKKDLKIISDLLTEQEKLTKLSD